MEDSSHSHGRVEGHGYYVLKGFSDEEYKNEKRVRIDNAIKEIPNDAFRGCSNLESVEIPPTVTKIGDRAFSECPKLETINIPASVSSIGYSIFKDSNELRDVRIGGDVLWRYSQFGGYCA